MQKEHDLTPVKNMRELADSIAKYNNTLNDTTIVYCQGEEGDDDLKKESTKAAVRLMRQESLNPILIVKDKELAKTARMEPGKFYVYYKPSFINGFEAYMEKDINFAYLQALEGVCRDDFSLNEAYITSDEFKNQLAQSRGLQTEAFAAEIFDQCFTRTFNVEFAFNPNFKEFTKKVKSGKQTKPILFVYSPPMYMSRYLPEFKDVLRNYTEVFDIYYTGDDKEAAKVFYTHELPDIFPYVVIIDPKKRKAVKRGDLLKEVEAAVKLSQDEKDAQAVKEQAQENLNDSNSYVSKYREVIYFNKIGKDLTKFIDKFLDGELHHFYQTEKVQQQTLVKKLSANTFEQEIVRNPNVTECIVEVFKHDCPSCNFNGKVFNALSRKLEKHGYGDRLPLYRLSIDNKIPFMGNFGYSPIYMYIRKRGNDIVELKTLDPPQRSEDMIKSLAELTQIKGLQENIKIKPREQVLKYLRLEDAEPDFDIDFDLKEEPPKPKVEETPKPAEGAPA